MDIKRMMVSSVLNPIRCETVHVYFKNGSDGDFTKRFVDEMMADEMVDRIVDNASGEIIYIA